MRLRYLTITAVMLAAGAAIAQDKPAPAGPVAFQDPLQLTISRAELQAIASGVMKLPYETAAPILNNLQAQLSAADKAATEAAKKLEEEKAKAAAPPPAPAAPPAPPAK